LLVLTARRGDEKRALELILNSREDATGRGEGRAITLAEYVTAVLYNGLGRYPAALAAAERAAGYDDLDLCGLIELVEAAARTGSHDAATPALRQLSRRAQASRTDWALGAAARSRALLTDGSAAEELYREAIERLGRTRIAVLWVPRTVSRSLISDFVSAASRPRPWPKLHDRPLWPCDSST
jgi:hypothetical protein